MATPPDPKNAANAAARPAVNPVAPPTGNPVTNPVNNPPAAHHTAPQAPGHRSGKADSHTVRITAGGFSPESLPLKVGETVSFVNEDSVAHNVTFDAAPVISADVPAGESYEHTVTAVGRHAYHEKDHPERKGGALDVTE